MAGHSHWAGVKHQKSILDRKRAEVFSKLLAAVSASVRTEPNPDFNPRLRTAIEKAREEKVPQEAIERAIRRASESGEGTEEVIFEAYGPGGTAMIITGATDNKNRSVQEVKKILSRHGAKWAESRSVRWAFELTPQKEWRAKFNQKLTPEHKRSLDNLIKELEERDDIRKVFANAK